MAAGRGDVTQAAAFPGDASVVGGVVQRRGRAGDDEQAAAKARGQVVGEAVERAVERDDQQRIGAGGDASDGGGG